ncbi:hypothetical protein [Nocardia noduli]|uniref:hypothetical protein n=1 Tax=Nocardia noduli TaxID=2815722 RepID=UPI001C221E40|nr:hypothetical protein [Nocardia noduli]
MAAPTCGATIRRTSVPARTTDRLNEVAAEIRSRARVQVITLPVDLNDREQTRGQIT